MFLVFGSFGQAAEKGNWCLFLNTVILVSAFVGLSAVLETVSFDGIFSPFSPKLCESFNHAQIDCAILNFHHSRHLTLWLLTAKTEYMLQTSIGKLETCLKMDENRKKYCFHCAKMGHFGHVSIMALLHCRTLVRTRTRIPNAAIGIGIRVWICAI